MTSSAAPARRLVLVPSAPARRSSAGSDARLRRYKLARVTAGGRAARPDVALIGRTHD